MIEFRPGGARRIDRVLAEDYLAGLPDRPLPDIRALRAEAEQEEVDLSYLRRLLHGRIDILRAELDRRVGGSGTESIVADLPRILADQHRGPARGLGRHTAVEPSRADSHRRYVESLVADVVISDVGSRSEAEISAALGTLGEAERSVSEKRRAVQQVMDACSAEITRRYRDGEANVADLLAGEGSAGRPAP